MTSEGLVVYGAGGHGRTLIDLLRSTDHVHPAVVIDDGDVGAEVLGVPVAGGADALASQREAGHRLAANGIGPIRTTAVRARVFDVLAAAGFEVPALVHARAIVEPTASLADGSQVLAGAYVGTSARLGYGAIVNTLAIVSHDSVIGVLAHLCPGAMLSGEVTVGARTVVGVGSTVHVGVTIGDDVLLGMGAVVKADVPAGTHVRAGTTWPS